MRHPATILSAVLMLCSVTVSGQYYDTGQDPASLKWMQIKTDRFTIIYPRNYGTGGADFAQSLDEAMKAIKSIYPEKKFRIPVIIHNNTTQSNGYVAWAPKRMELYPTPEQNSIPLAADKQLAYHELTHVFQMASLQHGFSKGMSFVLGEQFTGIVAVLLPEWFLEGDAVFAETALTPSGRGRIPSFQKQLKAIAVEREKFFSYDRIIHGSYREFVPDHYESGYQMVTWSLAKYNPEIWNNVLNYAAGFPFTVNPVNISLSKNSSLTKKRLFRETFDSLKSTWTKDVERKKSVAYNPLNPPKNGKFVSYFSPVSVGSDSIIAVKTSLYDPPAFVLINTADGSEKKIHIPGQMYPRDISYGGRRLVWVENQTDPRWENRNYSVVKIMSIDSRIALRLSKRSRYLAASVSPDGRRIAAVENTTDNKNNLVILNAAAGEVLELVPSPGNAALQRPRWTPDGRKIALIYLNGDGEGIMSYTPDVKKWEVLSEAGRDDIQSVYLQNDSLLFISSRSGTDNLYLKTPEGRISGITNSRFGTTDMSVDGNTLLFSDYTSYGNNVCRTSLDENHGYSTENTSDASFLINRIDIKQEPVVSKGLSDYTPEPYRKWKHLFNFHSWMPFYADIEQVKTDPAAIRPGVTLMTQNQLSTLISSFGYEYSQQKSNVIHSKITWSGWYPVIESRFDYGEKPLVLKTGANVNNPSTLETGRRFVNTISLPLRFNPGKFSQYLYSSLSSDYRNDYFYLADQGSYDYGQLIVSGRFYFSNYSISAYRDIYPRWAQTFDLNYTYAPSDKMIYGNSLSLNTSFYFPGFLKNHSVKIRYDNEKQNPSKYLFGMHAHMPRGYNDILSSDIEFYSVDYALPLVCPDLNVPGFLYLKRIRAGLFYDYATGPGNTFYEYTPAGLSTITNNSSPISVKSFGLQMLADFHVLRIPYVISSGFQASWKNMNEKPVLELLFNIDIYGMSIGTKHP
jgi:hypothetical protein